MRCKDEVQAEALPGLMCMCMCMRLQGVCAERRPRTPSLGPPGGASGDEAHQGRAGGCVAVAWTRLGALCSGTATLSGHL